MDDAKCPVMHGALTKNQGTGTSNKEWWPNQLNLSILHSTVSYTHLRAHETG